MSEAPNTPPAADPPKVPAAEANGQLIVSLAIVTAMVVIAVGLIVAGAMVKDGTYVTAGVFTIIGALATALNAPSGTSTAIRAAATKPTPPPAS